MEDLLERVIALAGAFDRAGVPHSFGGAIARAKDARDVRTLLDARGGQLDLGYVLRWVDEIVGPDAPSARDLRRALAERGLPAGA